MASIRNMGGCPCPRCTIPKSKLHLMGTKRDRRDRIKQARVDDHQRRSTIAQARKAIYEQNFDVDSAGVERMLKPLSLVPTSVSSFVATHWVNLTGETSTEFFLGSPF